MSEREQIENAMRRLREMDEDQRPIVEQALELLKKLIVCGCNSEDCNKIEKR